MNTLLRRFLCFLRGHKPRYALDRETGCIIVVCKTCKQEITFDTKGRFWP